MASKQNGHEKARFLGRDEKEEYGSLWDALKAPRSDRQQHIRQYCFLALNVSILLISIAVNYGTWMTKTKVEPLPRCIHNTDMKDAWPAIEYEERVYTGALVVEPEQQQVVRKQDADIEYFGPPSKELDNAWHELLHGEYPVMTAAEAKPYEPELRRVNETNEFHFEPDLFNSLHCLNLLRLEVSKTLYNLSSEKSSGAEHSTRMEHCLDQLRQSVMCHGDMTPSPQYSSPGSDTLLGRADRHTCRKWEPIRAWMDDRGAKGPLIS